MSFEKFTRGIPRALPSANAPPRARVAAKNAESSAEEIERKRANEDGLGGHNRGTMREPLVTASGGTRA